MKIDNSHSLCDDNRSWKKNDAALMDKKSHAAWSVGWNDTAIPKR